MDDLIYLCEKCGHRVRLGVNFCENCGTKVSFPQEKERAKAGKTRLNRDLLKEFLEYPDDGRALLFAICAAPFILAILVLTHKGKIRRAVINRDAPSGDTPVLYRSGAPGAGMTDETIIKRAKIVRRYCSWCLVLSALQFVFVLPLFGFYYAFEIRKRADRLIKDYEGSGNRSVLEQ